MTNSWINNDKQFADGYGQAIRKVVDKVASKIVRIETASDQEDREYATDYIVTVDAGQIACRIRRPNIAFRDLTLRAWRASGAKTELEKIKAGFARWYLYAWAQDASNFAEWMLLDLNKLRTSKLLERHREFKFNRDETTAFIHISLSELDFYDVIVEADDLDALLGLRIC